MKCSSPSQLGKEESSLTEKRFASIVSIVQNICLNHASHRYDVKYRGVESLTTHYFTNQVLPEEILIIKQTTPKSQTSQPLRHPCRVSKMPPEHMRYCNCSLRDFIADYSPQDYRQWWTTNDYLRIDRLWIRRYHDRSIPCPVAWCSGEEGTAASLHSESKRQAGESSKERKVLSWLELHWK